MSFQTIGDVCLIKKKDRKLANEILREHPRFRAVFYQSKISGKFRKPQIIWLAGSRKSEVLHKENYCFFKLNIREVMFSKGNQEEKRRMVRAVKPGEVVVDMFAGIGYWAIPIAKFSKPKVIYAIELNPRAFRWLKENVRINKVADRVVPLKGNCAKWCEKLAAEGVRADRVIMGYFEAEKFLRAAKKVLKKEGIIYFHFLAGDDGKEKAKEIAEREGLKLLHLRKVKDYAPRVFHWVGEFGS